MTTPADYRIVVVSRRSLLGLGPVRHWWRLESAANSQVLAVSEVYGTLAKCRQTAERLGGATGIAVVEG